MGLCGQKGRVYEGALILEAFLERFEPIGLGEGFHPGWAHPSLAQSVAMPLAGILQALRGA
jgi:hypothetical protein